MQVQTFPFGPVWDALSGYRVLTSATPLSFDHKIKHVPTHFRSAIAVVVVDVLRATTTLLASIAAGSQGAHLAAKPTAGTYDLTPPFGTGTDWVYGGEKNGLAIPGGAFGNSPLEAAKCAALNGKFIKFFSTNGATALAAVENSGV